MILLIIILPLIGFILLFNYGFLLGIGGCYIASLNVLIAFIISFFLFYKITFLGLSYKLHLMS